jgi:hypothetical protein
MKESYEVRPRQSPRPRVMRRDEQPSRRSVHSAKTGDRRADEGPGPLEARLGPFSGPRTDICSAQP